MVALVGLTGAGKSTLASLVPRFYEPLQGRVLIDGIDVAQYRLRAAAAHRDRVAGRDAVWRHGRRESALRPAGRHPRGRAEAARAAHAHDFIMRFRAATTRRSRKRAAACRRRTPAAQHRARPAERRADPDPRRADITRCDLGGGGLRCVPSTAPGPHHARHRPSPIHHPRRRSHSRPARGPHRGAGHARRAACRPISCTGGCARVSASASRWTIATFPTSWSRRSDRADR